MTRKSPANTKRVDLPTLQAEWDEKLRRSGFEDIEDRQTGMLKTWSRNARIVGSNVGRWQSIRNSHSPTDFSKKDAESYYRLACAFLHEHDFRARTERRSWEIRDRELRSQFDRRCWELHAEGMPLRHIGRQLRVPWWKARKVVDRLRAEMKRRLRAQPDTIAGAKARK